MSKTSQSYTLKNAVRLSKPHKTPMIVIQEAVTNAMEAIQQRKEKYSDDFTGEIAITIYLQKNLAGILGISQLDIADNGIGFNEENRERFHSYGDTSKQYQNNGTGKIQFLHWFDKIKVDSLCLSKDGTFEHYQDTASVETDFDWNIAPTDFQNHKTTVALINLFPKTAEQDGVQDLIQLADISVFKNAIIKMFLPYLVCEEEKRIKFSLHVITKDIDGKVILNDNGCILQKDVDFERSVEKAEVQRRRVLFKEKQITFESIRGTSQEITIENYCIPVNKAEGNGVYFARKQAILSKYYPKDLGFNLSSHEKTSTNGFYNISVIKGRLFDSPEYISDTGTWNFPSKNQIKERDIILETEGAYFIEDVNQAITPALTNAFSALKATIEKNSINVAKVMKDYGFRKNYGAKINIDDSESQIVRKLYKALGAHNAENSIKMMEAYQHFKELEALRAKPLSDNFQRDLEETTSNLLHLTDVQNRDELSKYIIRRDIVVKVLENLIQHKIDPQGQPEGIIHDLIFKRKSNGDLNDLWLFNEDFVHYKATASDIPLQDICIGDIPLFKNPKDIKRYVESLCGDSSNPMWKRPDIFLFTETGSCVLIELKAPDVKVEAHMNQIYSYARILATFAEVEGKRLNRFYGYLIGGELNPLVNLQDFKAAPCDEFWFKAHTAISAIKAGSPDIDGASLYQEIIPYATVAKIANKRNRSFAKKLGLE